MFGVHDSLAAEPGALLQAQRRCQASTSHCHSGQTHYHDNQRKANVSIHSGQDLGKPGTGNRTDMYLCGSCIEGILFLGFAEECLGL